jgi:hypothetical protein
MDVLVTSQNVTMELSSRDQESIPWRPSEGVGAHHHYVPKSYLERFCGLDGNLNVLETQTGNRYKNSPYNAAKQKDLTTFNLNTEAEKGSLEGLLRLVEEPMSELLRRFGRSSLVEWPPDGVGRQTICLYVAIQFLRTLKVKSLIENNADQLMKNTIRSRAQNPEAYGLEPVDQNDLEHFLSKVDFRPTNNNLHIQVIAERLQPFSRKLIRRYLYIFEWRDFELATSDHPVILRNTPGWQAGAGLDGIEEILFPIDPRRLLVISRTPKYGQERIIRGVENTFLSQEVNELIRNQASSRVYWMSGTEVSGL